MILLCPTNFPDLKNKIEKIINFIKQILIN